MNESIEMMVPFSAEDLKVAMERCDIGPCQLMIDKNNPPIVENLKNTQDLESKLVVPTFPV